MPKGPKGQKRPADVSATPLRWLGSLPSRKKRTLTDDGKDKAAVSLGHRGGKARAEALSQKQRKAIAKKAASARWKKDREPAEG